MWGNDGIDDEGGFNVTMTQSPASAVEPKQNTVIHVTVRELINSSEENKNTHVVVVGIIKQVQQNCVWLIYLPILCKCRHGN